MRITSKGQVTIPIHIREQLGLLPQTEVEFEIDGNSVRIRRAAQKASSRGQRIVELLKGQSRIRMTTDEIMSHTRS